MAGVLIVVSGDSIAHSLRPVPVALQLRRQGVVVRFAGAGPYQRFIEAEGFDVEPFPMLAYARVQRWQFDDVHALYQRGEFADQVEAQATRLRALEPEVVLQDGPDATLVIAAAEAGVPIYNLANATTLGLAGRMRYTPFRPRLHRVARRRPRLAWGLDLGVDVVRNLRLYVPLLAHVVRSQLWDAGYQQVLMPDLAELFGSPWTGDKRRFVGPILYEPPTPTPVWWEQLDPGRPLVYVALGSSGGTAGFDAMVQALAGSRYQVVLSTAAAFEAGALPDNFFASPLVPRDQVLARAAALVYHGGSATTYQAIEHAVPMIAVPGHFDQDFNARAVEKQGLGRMILPLDLSPAALRQAVDEVVTDPAVAAALVRMQPMVRASRGAEIVTDVLIQAMTRDARARRAEVVHRRYQARRSTWRRGGAGGGRR